MLACVFNFPSPTDMQNCPGTNVPLLSGSSGVEVRDTVLLDIPSSRSDSGSGSYGTGDVQVAGSGRLGSRGVSRPLCSVVSIGFVQMLAPS
jgi:hypothetical protein